MRRGEIYLADLGERVGHEPGRSGLAATSYIKCEDLRAVSPVRLGRRFGDVEDVTLLQVEVVARRLLGVG